jgi:hypothetical protein
MKTQAERWAFDGVDREHLERTARDLRTLLFAFDNEHPSRRRHRNVRLTFSGQGF